MVFNYTVNIVNKGNPFGELGASASVFENHLMGINKGINALNQSFLTVQQRGSSAFGGLMSQAQGLFGAVAALGVGKSMMTFTANMEQTHLAFEVLLKDGDKANVMIGQLNKFADVTPFSNDEVIKAGKSLLALGFSTETIMPKLTMLGDLASGLNIPFGELTSAFGKMKAKGKIQADELNIFLDRGINILPELARQLHVAQGSIFDLASKGGVSFKDLDTALTNLAKNDFGGLMARQSETLGGQWSTLMGSVQQLGLAIGTQLLPFAKSLVNDYLSPAVSFLTQHSSLIIGLGKAVWTLAGAVGAAWAASKLHVFWLGLQNTALLLQRNYLLTGSVWQAVYMAMQTGLTGTTALLTTALEAMNLAFLMNPIFLAIAAGIAFGEAIYQAWHHCETFRATLYGLWAVIKLFGKFLYDYAIAPLYAFGEILVGVFTGNTELIKKGMNDGIEAIKANVHNYLTAGQQMGAAFRQGFNDGKNDFNGIRGAQSVVSTDALSRYWSERDGGGKPKGTEVSNTTKSKMDGISGGGRQVRNITINVNKVGVDALTIQSTTITEGSAQMRDIIMRDLLQVINSANQVQ